jgi:hypothetical protein
VQPLIASLAKRQESVTLKGFSDPIGFVRLTPQAYRVGHSSE